MIKLNIPLPRLLNASGGTERYINATNVSVNLSITPLSYASINLEVGEFLPARGYVELYTSMGSAGIFRVRSPQDAYGEDQTSAELEHAIVEVGDWCVLQKYDEMMAANVAMQTVFSHYRGGMWQLGDVSALGTGQISVSCDHDRILEVMLGLLDQVPNCMLTFDFTTSPWTVAVAQRGSTVAAEGRMSRNIASAKVTYDDSELCTRGYYDVTTYSEIEDLDEESTATTIWTALNADTQSRWGIVERSIPSSAGATAAEALRVAQEYMAKHKNPRISISMNAEDLSAITGEPWDTFTIGKLFRLALPDYDTTVEQVITGLSWQDVYGSPASFTVSLAEEEDTAVEFIHQLDSNGGTVSGGGGGGGGSAKKKLQEEKEFWTSFEKTDEYIKMMAVHQNKDENIFDQAGLELDAEGVLIYARKNNSIASHIQVQADRISLVVEGTGANASIKAAQIVAAINNGESSILLSADHIDIDGVVTALEAYDISCGNLVCGTINSSSITSDDVVDAVGFWASQYIYSEADIEATSGFTLGNDTATWQSQLVLTSLGKSTYTKKFRLADGTEWEHQVVTDVNANSTTINYLGT